MHAWQVEVDHPIMHSETGKILSVWKMYEPHLPKASIWY